VFIRHKVLTTGLCRQPCCCCGLQDGIGEFFADADTKLYWVSFLDGMQRILLFTDDIAVATVAQQVKRTANLHKLIVCI